MHLQALKKSIYIDDSQWFGMGWVSITKPTAWHLIYLTQVGSWPALHWDFLAFPNPNSILFFHPIPCFALGVDVLGFSEELGHA